MPRDPNPSLGLQSGLEMVQRRQSVTGTSLGLTRPDWEVVQYMYMYHMAIHTYRYHMYIHTYVVEAFTNLHS